MCNLTTLLIEDATYYRMRKRRRIVYCKTEGTENETAVGCLKTFRCHSLVILAEWLVTEYSLVIYRYASLNDGDTF
jgi:hypothetical protein